MGVRLMGCPICKKESYPFVEIFDDRYGYPGVFVLLKCESCDHLFISKKFSDEEISNLYSNYYPRSKFDISQCKAHPEKNKFSLWLDGDYRSAYRWVPKRVTVLDVGCGFGESLAYHTSRGCDVYGVEADENIRQVADKYGYRVHIGLFDPEVYEPNFFEFITMDQVIEHIADPVAALKGINNILKKDGCLLLAVPNPQGWGAKFFGKKWINWHAPYHLQHYSISSMAAIAEHAGFHITQVKTVTSSNWLYFQWKHLITFPAAGEVSDFWGSKKFKNFTVLKKLLLIAAWLSHKFKLNHIITRFFDMLGIGDSRIFFLSKK